jgi:hypothetical protein
MLFGLSDEALYMREIERRSGFSAGAVQQELKKLVFLELLNPRRDGNRLRYQANRDHPLYNEVHNLVLKGSGLAGSSKMPGRRFR